MSCKAMRLRKLTNEELLLPTEKVDQIRVHEALHTLAQLTATREEYHTAEHIIEHARAGDISATPEQLAIIANMAARQMGPLPEYADGGAPPAKEPEPKRREELQRKTNRAVTFDDMLEAIVNNPKAPEDMRELARDQMRRRQALNPAYAGQ